MSERRSSGIAASTGGIAVVTVAFLALIARRPEHALHRASDSWAGSMPATNPRRLAELVASDLSAALDVDPSLDIRAYVATST
jgi:hypothetical protein